MCTTTLHAIQHIKKHMEQLRDMDPPTQGSTYNEKAFQTTRFLKKFKEEFPLTKDELDLMLQIRVSKGLLV